MNVQKKKVKSANYLQHQQRQKNKQLNQFMNTKQGSGRKKGVRERERDTHTHTHPNKHTHKSPLNYFSLIWFVFVHWSMLKCLLLVTS